MAGGGLIFGVPERRRLECMLEFQGAVLVVLDLHAAEQLGLARMQFDARGVRREFRRSSPGYTSANFPNGFDGKIRSLMLAITSPHSSRICAV